MENVNEYIHITYTFVNAALCVPWLYVVCSVETIGKRHGTAFFPPLLQSSCSASSSSALRLLAALSCALVCCFVKASTQRRTQTSQAWTCHSWNCSLDGSSSGTMKNVASHFAAPLFSNFPTG